MENEIDIPAILCSSDTGNPMDHCMVCGNYLLDEGTPYFIEKSMRQYPDMRVQEVIFEYAVCLHCSVTLSESMSKESRKRTTEYMMKHAHFESRGTRLAEIENYTIDPWIERCLLKDTPIAAAQEFQIVAQCMGRKLLLHDMPFALCQQALEELTDLLSNETLGEIDDFIGKYFTGPPELAEILRKRPPVLL